MNELFKKYAALVTKAREAIEDLFSFSESVAFYEIEEELKVVQLDMLPLYSMANVLKEVEYYNKVIAKNAMYEHELKRVDLMSRERVEELSQEVRDYMVNLEMRARISGQDKWEELRVDLYAKLSKVMIRVYRLKIDFLEEDVRNR